jgi:hypothetical protein
MQPVGVPMPDDETIKLLGMKAIMDECSKRMADTFYMLTAVDFGAYRKEVERQIKLNEEHPIVCDNCLKLVRARLDMMEAVHNEFKAYAIACEKYPCK